MTTRRETTSFTMEGTTDRRNTYSTGEGDPSTGVVGGSQVGPTTSSTYDHGRSGVGRQAPERVTTPGEARSLFSEEYMETSRTPRTRSGCRAGSVFLAPAPSDGATTITTSAAGGSRERARSDDEESVASFASRSSLASIASRGKKRRLATTATLEVSEDLEIQVRTSSAADVSAELTRHVSEIMKVATTSSNLKGTYVKALKEAASYISAAWKSEAPRRREQAGSSGNNAAMRLVEARLSALEEENAALRRELARRSMPAIEGLRGGGADTDRPRVEAATQEARLDALERKLEELGPSITKMVERQLGSLLKPQQQQQQQLQQQRQQQQSTPETRRSAEYSATRPPARTDPPPPPRTREDGGWSVVVGRKSKMGQKNIAERKLDAAGGEEKSRPPATVQKPWADRMGGAPKSGSGGTVKKPFREEKTSPTVKLPRAPSTSAVTLTLSEGANMSYADVVTMARRAIPLGEIGVEAVTMKKAVTGAIVIRVPRDKDREKASILATRLADVLDPTKVRVGTPTIKAELRVTNVDISMGKEELRQALALAAGCSSEDVRIGEIGVSRGGLGSAWVRCPAAGARKLAQAGRVALGWSIARVSAIPKRPLQCFKCLELGHVRATCTSAEDRSRLCYRCGESGHRARGCPALAPKCPLCERLGAPSGHRMGGVACAPPKIKRSKGQLTRRSAAAADTVITTIAGGNENYGGNATGAESPSAVTSGREEAMELAE